MAGPSLKSSAPLSAKGIFGGGYQVGFTPFAEPLRSYSSVCFVFAGQGAIYPGMFAHLYQQFESVRQVFVKADAEATRLGLPSVSAFVVNPQSLTDTQKHQVQNLCLFAGELAIAELLLNAKIYPKALTAHSFGEYAALVCAGIVPFEQMFELVAFREVQSPPKNEKGYLVAIHADEAFTKQLLKSFPCPISNLNSASQTVVACPPEKLSALDEFLTKEGVRHKVLPTPQPYHSSFLSEMPPKMRAWLGAHKLTLHSATLPVFSSVTHAWVEEPSRDVPFIIENQMTERVDFIDQIHSISRYGCDQFIEIGPAMVLTPLIETITGLPRHRLALADDYFEDYKKHAAVREERRSPNSNKLLESINRIISSVTGYRIEDISVEDKFQEDLGIDSIKKTEIVFSVFDEVRKEGLTGINTAGIHQVGDLLQVLENAQQNPIVPAHTQPAAFARFQKTWTACELVVDIPSPLPTLYIDIDFSTSRPLDRATWRKLRRLSKEGRFNCVLMYPPSAIDWDFLAPDALRKVIEGKILPLMKVVQKFIRSHQSAFEGTLALVSQGKKDPLAQGFAAFLKSVRKENPKSFVKHVHFETPLPPEALGAQLFKELQDVTSPEVVYRRGERYLASLEALDEEDGLPHDGQPRVVIALGGAKGITRSLVESLSSRFPIRLYLLGRSPQASIQSSLQSLEGKVSDLSYTVCDATDFAKLEQTIGRILARERKIDFILNGAGIEISQGLGQKTGLEMRKEIFNKVLPAFYLTCLCRSLPQTKLIQFSSVVSEFGNAGQTVYAWANQFINTLGEVCQGQTLSIAWPPWDGVGMTAPLAIQQGLKRLGVGLLTPESAAELFEQDLGPAHDRLRTVYYYDPADYPAYGLALRKLAPYAPLLGTPLLVGGKAAFSRLYAPSSDPFLQDHRVGGRAYLPGAVGAALLLGLGRASLGYYPRLESLKFTQPIIFPEKKTALTSVYNPRTHTGEVGLGSPAFIAHFRSPRRAPSVLRLPAETSPLPTENFYGPQGMFHGPSFQLVDKAWKHGTHHVRVLLKHGLAPILDNGLGGKLSQWIDGAFQSLALFPLTEEKALFLPVEVGELEVFLASSPLEAHWIYVERTGQSSSHVEGSAQVLNEKLECLVSLTGVQCQLAMPSKT